MLLWYLKLKSDNAMQQFFDGKIQLKTTTKRCSTVLYRDNGQQWWRDICCHGHPWENQLNRLYKQLSPRVILLHPGCRSLSKKYASRLRTITRVSENKTFMKTLLNPWTYHQEPITSDGLFLSLVPLDIYIEVSGETWSCMLHSSN